MPHEPKPKTEDIAILPSLVSDLKERMNKVEEESVNTRIYMAKVDERMGVQTALLGDIKQSMRAHDTFINKAKGIMLAMGAVGGVIGEYVYKLFIGGTK